jgi:hypothetical protein
MKHKFDIRETVARALSRGRSGAGRPFLRWLDHNGYTIVEKETDQASLVPGMSEGNVAAQDKLVTER